MHGRKPQHCVEVYRFDSRWSGEGRDNRRRGLAALAIGRGAHSDAIEHCQRALKIDPHDERAWLMLAGACLRARRYTEARTAAEQVAGLRGGGISVDAILADIGN